MAVFAFNVFFNGYFVKHMMIRSFLYSSAQISQGLIFHPYQTMQSLVQEKVFVWMSLLPTVFMAFVTIFWKIMLTPLIGMIFSCREGSEGWMRWLIVDVFNRPFWLSYGATQSCRVLPFISDWLIFFCIYWQIMLLYLLFRFKNVFGRS